LIAADTSTWIAYLGGEAGPDADLLDRALRDRQVVMIPAVLTELLSDPALPEDVAAMLADVPLVDLRPGFWQRAGRLRAAVLAKQRKARLGDALIAQACLDASVPLVTRDRDFQAFEAASGLDVALTRADR